MITISPAKQIEALYERLEWARELIAEGLVFPVLGKDGHFVVQVCNSNACYLVNGECSCDDARLRTDLHRGWCRHMLAVSLYKEARSEDMTTISPVKQIEELYKRLEKARQLNEEGKVNPLLGAEGQYVVHGKGGFYLVGAGCTCQDAQHRTDLHKGCCKHSLAVSLFRGDEAEVDPEESDNLQELIDELY